MATQTVQFVFRTGLIPVVRLFADDGSDTILDTPTATEATNRTGLYTFTQTDRAAGDYLITVSASGVNAAYRVTLTLTTAYFNASDLSLVDNVSEIQSGLSTLAEANIRTAVGLAAANLDTQLSDIDNYLDTEVSAIKSKTDLIPAAPAAVGSAMTLEAGERTAIGTAVWDTTTRTLSSFGSLVADVATAVWSAVTRTLTSGGGGGGTTVVVHPGYATWPEKVVGKVLTVFHNEAGTLGPIRVQSREDDAYTDVDLTALTGLYFLVKDFEMTEVYNTSSITISGTEDSQFSCPITTDLTGTLTKETPEEWHYWSLRDEDDNFITGGRMPVRAG